MHLEALKARFPRIEWEKPIPVVIGLKSCDFACRVCIAAYGLSAATLPQHPDNQAAFDYHMAEHRRAPRPM